MAIEKSRVCNIVQGKSVADVEIICGTVRISK